jgi:hypothetical protein
MERLVRKFLALPPSPHYFRVSRNFLANSPHSFIFLSFSLLPIPPLLPSPPPPIFPDHFAPSTNRPSKIFSFRAAEQTLQSKSVDGGFSK